MSHLTDEPIRMTLPHLIRLPDGQTIPFMGREGAVVHTAQVERVPLTAAFMCEGMHDWEAYNL